MREVRVRNDQVRLAFHCQSYFRAVMAYPLSDVLVWLLCCKISRFALVRPKANIKVLECRVVNMTSADRAGMAGQALHSL